MKTNLARMGLRNMKNKINLNILGLKNFNDVDLTEISSEVEKIKVGFDSILHEPLSGLRTKIRVEQGKRERRNWVWVRFTCSWSGYSNNPSAPRRTLGAEYRKVKRDIAEKMPKYYCHRFSDGSTNDWNIEIVSVKKKEKGSSYPQQIDEFMRKNEN